MRSSSSRIYRQPTLLPGGRPLPPTFVFLAIAAMFAASQSLAFTTYGLYVVRGVELSAFELVLAGVLLEGSYFLGEIPTGVVADVYSRRLSIIVGVAVTAVGLATFGLVPAVWFVFAGQMLYGFGATFLSGATEAWVADEVGEAEARGLYFRAAQVRRAGALAGIPIAVALASVSLQLPMLAGGALLGAFALVLLLTMTERGYRPVLDDERSTWQSMVGTTAMGLRTVRRRPSLVVLVAVIGIAAGAGEGLARLFPLYALEVIGLPETGWISEEVWFGIFGVGGLVGGIAATGLARRVTDLERLSAIVRTLVVFGAVSIGGLLVFALTDTFWVMLAGFWVATWAGAAAGPLHIVWINRGLDPRTRATVISLVGQADPLGQIAGGPAFGLVATLRGVRASMFAVGLALLPTLPLYVLGSRIDRGGAGPAEPPAGGPPDAAAAPALEEEDVV